MSEHSSALDPLVHRLVGEIEERGLTREQVSLDAGLGKDTIGSWARGQRTPNIGNLRAALQVVGLELGARESTRAIHDRATGVARPQPCNRLHARSESSLSGIPCVPGETSQK